MYQSNKLLECQKEFLFNSKYGFAENDNYKTLNYYCSKTNLMEKIDIDLIREEDLPLLIEKIFNAISIHCDGCACRM